MRRQTEHSTKKYENQRFKRPKNSNKKKKAKRKRRSWSPRKRVVSWVAGRRKRRRSSKDGTKMTIHKIYFLNAHYSHFPPPTMTPQTVTWIQKFSSFVHGFAHHNRASRCLRLQPKVLLKKKKNEERNKKVVPLNWLNYSEDTKHFAPYDMNDRDLFHYFLLLHKQRRCTIWKNSTIFIFVFVAFNVPHDDDEHAQQQGARARK